MIPKASWEEDVASVDLAYLSDARLPPILQWAAEAAHRVGGRGSPEIELSDDRFVGEHRRFLEDRSIRCDDAALAVGTGEVVVRRGVRVDDEDGVFDGSCLNLGAIGADFGLLPDTRLVG